MTALLRVGGLVALALTLAPCLLLVAGTIDGGTNRTLMTAGTALWFVVQLVDMRRERR